MSSRTSSTAVAVFEYIDDPEDEALLHLRQRLQRVRVSHTVRRRSSLAKLRRRIAAARLPEKETVSDFSQGVTLATVQKLAKYWATEYDWRKVEARLNAVPNFITEIDGPDIHFIHVRSKHESALPLLVSHGWPVSIIEQLKLIAPLTSSGDTEAGSRFRQSSGKEVKERVAKTRSIVVANPGMIKAYAAGIPGKANRSPMGRRR